ncbi:MAG: ATP synthase F0 subunit C [Ruminococcus sp.]|nr:ATP synthase F0 subunit C [Ruminococcus sp.]
MVAVPVFAAGETEEVADTAVSTEAITDEAEDNTLGDKAWAAAIVVGIAAAAGAIGMGMAIAKSVEGISRQPEAEGKIRTTLMLGLVFVETAIIYALVIAILIIFVL